MLELDRRSLGVSLGAAGVSSSLGGEDNGALIFSEQKDIAITKYDR